MGNSNIPVYFYVPENPAPYRKLPRCLDEYWSWICQVEPAIKWDGRFSWTLQTYLQLKAARVEVELVERLPGEGIVIAHRDFVPDQITPSERWLLVVLKPDRHPHPFAQMHVMQTPDDPYLSPGPDSEPPGMNGKFWRTCVIPPWPQPGLVPRDEKRGDRFSTVCYFGRLSQLARALRAPAWCERVRRELGLTWQVVPLSRWHDYSEVDLVVAVRGFGEEIRESRGTSDDVRMKPASKLTNSWLAGVPAIVGAEPSYQLIRKNPLDFVEANCLEDVVDGIRLLAESAEMRRTMVESGRQRAIDFTVEALRQRWHEFLTGECVPLYSLWQDLDYRSQFFLRRNQWQGSLARRLLQQEGSGVEG